MLKKLDVLFILKKNVFLTVKNENKMIKIVHSYKYIRKKVIKSRSTG